MEPPPRVLQLDYVVGDVGVLSVLKTLLWRKLSALIKITNMNEILLLIGAIVLIMVSSNVIPRIKNPLRIYVRIAAGTLLLAFVWLSNEMKVPISIILTAIVLYGLYKEYMLLKAETAINSEGPGKERNT